MATIVQIDVNADILIGNMKKIYQHKCNVKLQPSD